MSFNENEAINADDQYRQALRIGSSAKDVAATKQFAVSATGNLFVATTLSGNSVGDADIPKEAKKAFGQVSVFFAAMTKAMVSENGDSRVYDYETINKVVSGSGMFVKMTDSLITFESKEWGIKFGIDLIETLFGLSGGLGAIAKSLSDMIMGVGKEAKSITVDADTEETEKRVGTIIFVCEYLLGAVSITPIVLSINAYDAKEAFNAGPCLKAGRKAKRIRIVKQVYSFVAPELIKEAGTLNDALDDKELNKLVNQLKSFIEDGIEQPVQPNEPPPQDT